MLIHQATKFSPGIPAHEALAFDFTLGLTGPPLKENPSGVLGVKH